MKLSNISKFIRGHAFSVVRKFRMWIKRSDEFDGFFAKVVSLFMKLSFHTTRWIVVGKHFPEEYHSSGRPFIVCLWHDRLMLAPCVWKWKKRLHVLASDHRDGRLIAKVVENFSMPAVHGSTGNGFLAAKKLVHLARKGECVAVIPDGPLGPRHKLSPGVVVIAKLAKTDILTFSFCVKRYNRLNSWDRFIIAWPFNRGVMVWNAPIRYKDIKDLSEEEAVKLVEASINEASQRAHRILTNA